MRLTRFFYLDYGMSHAGGLVPRVRRGKLAPGVACRAPVTRATSLWATSGCEGDRRPLQLPAEILEELLVWVPTNSNKDFESSS